MNLNKMKNAFSDFLDYNEKRLSDHGSSLEGLLGQITQLNDKYKNLESKCQILTDENITLRNELIIVKKQNDESEKQVAQLKSETEELRTIIDDQFGNLESKCQLLRDENSIMKKELKFITDRQSASNEDMSCLRKDTDVLRRNIDDNMRNLEAKYNTATDQTITFKEELKVIKQQNDELAKQIEQSKTEANKTNKTLDENTRYIQLIPPMVNKIESLETNVRLQINSLNEYHESQKETAKKVKILHQKLTEYISQMNASAPSYDNNYNSPQSHYHQDHRVPCRSPSTSSLLDGHMAGEFRSSTRHHNGSPHFNSKSDDILAPLYWKDDLSEISNVSEKLLSGVKELHYHNNRRTGIGGNSLYSDE